MAFVLEDGTGLPTANAYIGKSFMTSYHKDRGNSAALTGFSTAQINAAIVEASDYMDATFRFRGCKKIARRGSNTTSQGLEWPRTDVVTIPELETVPSDAVPSQVQAACAELALAALTISLLPNSTSTSVVSESSGAGPLSKSRTYRRAATTPIFHKAQRILQPLLLPDGFLRA